MYGLSNNIIDLNLVFKWDFWSVVRIYFVDCPNLFPSIFFSLVSLQLWKKNQYHVQLKALNSIYAFFFSVVVGTLNAFSFCLSPIWLVWPSFLSISSFFSAYPKKLYCRFKLFPWFSHFSCVSINASRFYLSKKVCFLFIHSNFCRFFFSGLTQKDLAPFERRIGCSPSVFEDKRRMESCVAMRHGHSFITDNCFSMMMCSV